QQEIDRDFVIFDFILSLTVALAGIGVANALLIQVRSRAREFSIYRVVGMSNGQMIRLLLIEGSLIGLVGAVLSAALGSILGAVSVAFLDGFTLFELAYEPSGRLLLLTSLGVIGVCLLAALYPALAATRVSSAESLHYE
ncbi:MAG: ABC transporter permease, partial [Gammaproteobacteria bacterium]